ncbi:MAG: hypothetical protein HWN79_05655 [Candidatus Lokiarchaeota archaeon]|nr:hypothetical protein [Candidatus Lokiarchaeota archaeon]
MPNNWDIGQKARELDEKSISERVKIERHSIKRVAGALFIYFLIILSFYFFL